MDRRSMLKHAVTATIPFISPALTTVDKKRPPVQFQLCLNTSTIMGQKRGVKKYIDIAARAGYDCIELWINDVKEYKKQGGSMTALKKFLSDSHLPVVDAIGFAPWMSNDETTRKNAFTQMREEMNMMAELGCPRIAAPSMGMTDPAAFDLFAIGERYRDLVALGRSTGVTPLLEFWGASPVFFHIGQAMMAAAVANDKNVKILADVYHLFRGNSGFEGLGMLDDNLIEVFHMNDYPGDIPRTEQMDKHRIYPGDGVAPLKQVIGDLRAMGGTKILSLELFNESYWKLDPLTVAKTGLEKMRSLVA